jgi:GntR family transcriptional regulator/MocR family aminotransferase
LLALALDRSLPAPLQRQLYAQIREAVLAGRLSAGSRLPSTRTLGQDLGCSRNTVIGAFDQLLAEGYLESRGGSGTYVTRVLPEALLSRRPRGPGGARPSPGPTARSPGPALSPGGGRLAAMGRVRSLETGAFAPGMPDLSLFPFAVWARLLGRAWRRPALDLTAGGDPAGYPPLRAAIARYLAAVRDVVCSADEVLVTGGAQPALDLVARLLLAPGDEVWIEEPGYPGLRGPLAAAGARLVPVPLDEEGLSVAAGRARAPKARLAVVAPSHQYPLGTTMSLARRLDLLEWAREANAWIVEDDYDSEYRYAGRPLATTASTAMPAGRWPPSRAWRRKGPAGPSGSSISAPSRRCSSRPCASATWWSRRPTPQPSSGHARLSRPIPRPSSSRYSPPSSRRVTSLRTYGVCVQPTRTARRRCWRPARATWTASRRWPRRRPACTWWQA